MSIVVVDASALLALLQSEDGGAVVEESIEGAAIASVNLGEVAQRLFKEGQGRRDVDAIVTTLGLEVVPVDASLALDAAAIREQARAKGLSQADCICMALAKRRDAMAMTADTAWAELAETLGIDVKLIR